MARDRQVSVLAAYWLVNRSGLPLVAGAGVAAGGGAGAGAGAEGGEAAGQGAEHEVARVVQPLLFSFTGADQAPTLSVRLGHQRAPTAQWCSPFGLGPGITVKRLTCRGAGAGAGAEPGSEPGEEREYWIGVFLSDPGATATHVVAVAGCFLPWHWPRPDRPRLLCVRVLSSASSSASASASASAISSASTPTPLTAWSGGARVDAPRTTHFACREVAGGASGTAGSGGGYVVLRVEVVGRGASLYVLVSGADAAPPPLLIHNHSPVSIMYHQAGCSEESVVGSHGTSRWALPEPEGARAVVLRAPGGTRACVQLADPAPPAQAAPATLHYQNFVLVAFTPNAHTDANGAMADDEDVLVLEVPLGSTKVILGKKRYGDRSQLWRRGPGQQLVHEGSSPPQPTDAQLNDDNTLSPHAMVDYQKVLDTSRTNASEAGGSKSSELNRNEPKKLTVPIASLDHDLNSDELLFAVALSGLLEFHWHRLILLLWLWASGGAEGQEGEGDEGADEAEGAARRSLSDLTALAATRYYFGLIKVMPSQIRLSMTTASKLEGELSALKRRLGLTLIRFEDAAVELEPFVRAHAFEPAPQLAAQLLAHFKDELKWQAAKILGSVDFLGNPLGFVADVSEGVTGLLLEGNVAALLQNVTHGLSNSAAKVTESLGDGLERVVSDEAHEETRRRIRSAAPGAHLAAGFRGLGLGILGGVTSLVKHSYEGAAAEGLPGFLAGVGKGLVGTVTKPVIGVLDLAAETASALRDTSRRSDKWVPGRVRPPRVAGGAGGLLPRYSASAADGLQLLHALAGGRELFLAYRPVRDQPHDIRALLSDACLRILTCKHAAPAPAPAPAPHVVMETPLRSVTPAAAARAGSCLPPRARPAARHPRAAVRRLPAHPHLQARRARARARAARRHGDAAQPLHALVPAYRPVRDQPHDIRALLSDACLRILTCKHAAPAPAPAPHVVMETPLRSVTPAAAARAGSCLPPRARPAARHPRAAVRRLPAHPHLQARRARARARAARRHGDAAQVGDPRSRCTRWFLPTAPCATSRTTSARCCPTPACASSPASTPRPRPRPRRTSSWRRRSGR
ncbi:hypothetical protein evm_010730 [Chilo suppressalis]|nr:hypothetical protein evm_010730 [Chilo suppressalis]